jgi:hypothetical protein
MNTENLSISRKRRIAGNILVFMAGFILVASAGAKFAQVPQVVAQIGALGFSGNRLTFIAILEVMSAVIFLIPVTRSAGLLLVSSYLGGAISAHLGHGQPIFQPAMILFLLWLGAWLRHPEILWSINRSAVKRSQVAQQGRSEATLRQV